MSDENTEVTESGQSDPVAAAAVETAQAAEGTAPTAPVVADKTAEERSWQGRYDRLQAAVSKDLLGYVNTYGGGQNVVGFLKQFESLLGNQTLGPIVQTFLKTGQVEMPKPKNDWEAETTDDPWKQPLNSVLAELQQVKQNLTDIQRSQGMNAVSDYTKRFLAEYPLDETEKATFGEHMDQKLSALTATPNGSALLKNLDYQTFKSLALPGIESSLDNIIRRRQEKARSNAAARATDAPGRTAGNGNERTAPTMPTNAQQHAKQVREAFRRAMAAA